MAFTNRHLSEEDFLCSICIDVVTDPITTPCGHNHCKSCIRRYWALADACRCPLCKENFMRQTFSVNKVLSEMADQFRKAQQQSAEPDQVPCGFCSPVKLKAVKSCLVCQISYCETHLEAHQRVTALKRHKLIDPAQNLQDFMCKEHDRPLEAFCKTDRMCICQFCTESNHKSHHIVSLGEECEGMKAELEKTGAQVQQMVQERHMKIQEVKNAIELSRSNADRDIEETCMQFFTALGNRVEKHKTTEKQGEGFIKELQKEIVQLEKRISELRQLSHSEDHLRLLQIFSSINIPPPTKDWTNVNINESSFAGTVRTTVAQLERTLGEEMKKLHDAELRSFQKHAVDVTLDPDTAHFDLILSKDLKQVSYGTNNVPDKLDNKERFSYWTCVLGKQSFFSGRFYYEVQVRGTYWDLGVARESIKRKGQIDPSPNTGYWTIGLRKGNEYKALADPRVHFSVREELQTVGVFVDYEEGQVSFYDAQARVHLYSFTGCSFTERLYPLFFPEMMVRTPLLL